jgi:DNA-binding beta-propeller fold protein YncE
MRGIARIAVATLTAVVLLAGPVEESFAKKRKKKSDDAKGKDPYAEHVWPPPPDEPRIKLEAVIFGRADVEARSKFRRKLLAGSPQSAYDRFNKPHAVAFDPQGRILVTDAINRALLRFDREGRVMDVFGTQISVPLKLPLGLDVGADGTILVADTGGNHRVVAFDPEGSVVAVYGSGGNLENPTDAALSPDGKRVYVADAKAHQIVVFERESTQILDTFGGRGTGPGTFNFPTSLAFGPEGDLFVVDQLNFRVQMFAPDGEYQDEFGTLGNATGSFIRPKDIAVDELGLIYVVDNAFNNVQLFDIDFRLLTFVGAGGTGPGQFSGASGVAVRGEEIAVVDQMGARLQVFRFIVPKDQ